MNDLVARGEIVFGKHFVSHKNIFSHLEQDKTCLGFLVFIRSSSKGLKQRSSRKGAQAKELKQWSSHKGAHAKELKREFKRA